jgi:hypothetical protein
MGRRDCRRAMGRLRSGEGGASNHGRVKEISRRDAELAQSVKGLVSGRVPIPFSAFQSPKQQSHIDNSYVAVLRMVIGPCLSLESRREPAGDRRRMAVAGAAWAGLLLRTA